MIMKKGASSWRMQLPPPPQQKGANAADFRNGRAAAERSDKRKNFRESVAMAIAPSVNIGSAIQQHWGCEVDILHEGCCTVRFDTLAPHVIGSAEECERNAEQEEGSAQDSSAAHAPSDVGHAGGGSEEPRKHPSRRPRRIAPKPIVLQSTLPLPPQSELYFEVEFVSLSSQLTKPQTWSDISHVTVGVAPRPYPQQHLPGVLSQSCSISTTGAIHVGTPEPVMNVDALVEGDVLGVLLCRRSGTVLFLLNGAPLKSVACKEILFCETDPSTFTAPAGCVEEAQPAPGPDMYVTLGVIGRGECEVNFGGKSYTAHGYIRDIGGGIIQSNAPIQARAFGQRLANFSQMLAELQLFYQIYCPHMLPKAKGMVVMNVSRREAFEAELAANYGKSLKDVRAIVEDVLRRKLYNFLSVHDPSRLQEVDKILQTTQGEIERINALLMRVYHADLTGVSLRRKQSIGRMLREYHTLQKVDIEPTKLDRLAEEALQNPRAVDNFLREKYGKGINILLQKRLEQIYEAYAPENKAEIGPLMQKYPSFDDEYHMACKLKVKYNLDLYMFSPLEEDKKELAAIRRSLRPSKMNKQLKLLDAEDLKNTSTACTDNEGNRTPTSRSRSRVGLDARERKSIRRTSRATADMVAAVAAATAAAQAAENAAAAAAAAAANVKEQGMNKEKMREEREKRRKEREERRKSRLDKEALRDLLEMQLKQQAAEEEAAELQSREDTERARQQKQQVHQKRVEIEEKKKAVESALKIPDQEWWEAMREQEKQSDEEWEALEKQQQDEAEHELPNNDSPLGDKQAAAVQDPRQSQASNIAAGGRESPAARGGARKAVRLSEVAAGAGPARNSNAGGPGDIGGRRLPSSLKNSDAARETTAVVGSGSRKSADTERIGAGGGNGVKNEHDVGASEEYAEGPGKHNPGSASIVGQQLDSQCSNTEKLKHTERSDLHENEPKKEEGAAESEEYADCGTLAAGGTSRGTLAAGGTSHGGAAAKVAVSEIEDRSHGETSECAAAGAGAGNAFRKETGQRKEAIEAPHENAQDPGRLTLEWNGLKTRVSFAARTAANDGGNEDRATERRIAAGEAKSFVNDIVKRSSVKVTDAIDAAL